MPDEEEEVRPKPISNENIERFRSTVSCLNSLLLRTVVTNEGGERSNGYIINANGSYQSVIAWGKNAGMDEDQQTAFQILVSTYILTFLEEAEEDLDQNLEYQDNI